MKFFYLTLLLLGQYSNAQIKCEALFYHRLLVEFQTSPFDLFKERGDAVGVSQLSFVKSPAERLKLAFDLIKKRDVVVEESHVSSWLGLKKRPVLKFSIHGKSYLNTLSRSLYDKYGVQLVYDPTVVKHSTLGAYQGNKKILYVSEFTAATGEPDLTLLHEIRHAAMTSKEKAGKPAIINGMAVKWMPRWPWGYKSESSYKSYFNLQEVSTWFQGFKYQLLTLNQLARANRLSAKKAQELIDKIDFDALEVMNDSLFLVDYEISYYKRGPKRLTGYNGSKGIQFGDLNPAHFFIHTVPLEFIKKYLQGRSETKAQNLEIYFKSQAGKEVLNAIIIEYLGALKIEITAYRNFILGSRRILNETTNQLIFHEAKNQPISNLKPLFELLGKTADFGRVKKTHPDRLSDFSSLPPEGLDFTKLKSSDFTSEEKSFDTGKVSAENIRDVQMFIWSKFHYETYLKIEYEVLAAGQNRVLIIEGVGSSQIDSTKMLAQLAEFDIKFKSLKVSILKAKDNTNYQVAGFTEMTTEEAAARNLFRILELLPKP